MSISMSEPSFFKFIFVKKPRIILPSLKYVQGCGLRKITRSPEVPNHELLGAQHLSLYEKNRFFLLPKGKS